jgi:predicted transcriptional regulator
MSEQATEEQAPNVGGAPKKYTVEEVAEALRSQGGVISSAAKVLGSSRSTIYEYIRENPELGQVREETRESTIDMAEAQLFNKIREGHMTAIIFYLKTIGRERGYVERREIGGGKGVAPIPVEVHTPDLSNLTPRQRKEMRRMLKKLPKVASVQVDD